MIEGLDPKVWEGLRMLPRAARIELIDTYVEHSLTLLAQLRTAAETGDDTAFRFLVHSLKGCSASLGVHVLQHLCAELEQQARSGTLMDLAQAVQRVEIAHGDGVHALTQQRAALLSTW